ncbi:ROK family protein [Streptomyces sp. NPDC005438]|uniref:ROK family transcriptional regulator n=1 Tax=Streptomyces sp. NPDC005438 TaxID=3156880 RepID=UPI0033AB40CF
MRKVISGDPSLLRRINTAAVLTVLREQEPALALSLTELTRTTGLSRPTVEGVVENLLESGLVAEALEEGGDGRRGRPARHFRFRAEAGHLLGIEIGVRRLTVLLADLNGELVGSYTRQLEAETEAQQRMDRVLAVVDELLATCEVDRKGVRAVGVGTPGIVRQDGTIRLGTALPGWTGYPLGERLSASFDCAVRVENDANSAVLGEHWQGAAVGVDDAVFVMAGLSPGAGALIGGRLHRGHTGSAGEIGSLHLRGQELTPERLLSPDGEPLQPLDEDAVGEMLLRAQRGDAQATLARERLLSRLVHDVVALVVALDPQTVIVGGWAEGLEDLLDPLYEGLRRYLLTPPQVVLSALGESAVATGALRGALDCLEEELLSLSDG